MCNLATNHTYLPSHGLQHVRHVGSLSLVQTLSTFCPTSSPQSFLAKEQTLYGLPKEKEMGLGVELYWLYSAKLVWFYLAYFVKAPGQVRSATHSMNVRLHTWPPAEWFPHRSPQTQDAGLDGPLGCYEAFKQLKLNQPQNPKCTCRDTEQPVASSSWWILMKGRLNPAPCFKQMLMRKSHTSMPRRQ